MPTPEIMIEPRTVPGKRAPERPAAPMPDRRPVPPAPEKPFEPDAPRRPRRWRRIAGWLLLIVLVWCGWAAYALYDLLSALDNEDALALERRIDWTSVRQGLREDLRVMLGSRRLGENAPERTVEPLATQRAVIELVRSARLTDRGWDAAPAAAEGKTGRGLELLRISYAFFTGGPFAFRVDLRPNSDTVKRPMVLLFRWTGDWQLTRVFLPTDAFGNAPAAPPQQAAPVAPQAAAPAPLPKNAPPGAQKAILYEEDPSTPAGKSYTGWVTWRTEPGTGANAGDNTIVAQVVLPDRPLSMTMTFLRNLDRALPASHTIEVKFDIPPDSSTKGILDVVGVMMKPNEEVSGQQLAGTRVKVSNDFFLMGLSAIELDVQHNMQVLKDRPWLGVPFVYSNNSRAVLSIEKGEAGSKIIADEIARWSAAAKQ
ncbi:MAG: DUF2939 domain-containing protein [Xanthobacteraceae bacterium]|nr:DUF2939 domain-containing protein [Xanthobacteraceae bacterium]